MNQSCLLDQVTQIEHEILQREIVAQEIVQLERDQAQQKREVPSFWCECKPCIDLKARMAETESQLEENRNYLA